MVEYIPHTLIVKVTNGCNLGCKYCYAMSSPEQTKTISEHTLEKVLSEWSEIEPKRTKGIIWHGGEPLMPGMDFYERASWLQYWLNKKNGVRFDNSIQTNGSLVTEETISFCKNRNFSLGFSLDGPGEIHDITRPKADGTKSFEACFNGLRLAKRAGLSNGAIVVLNSRNIDHIEQIYNFFKEEGLSMKVNPLINAGNVLFNTGLEITPKQYSEALISLFNRYVTDYDFKGRIDPLDTIMGNFSTGLAFGCCTFGENCQRNFMSISPQGEIYPCGRFDGVESLSFGNIHEKSLLEILNSPIRKDLLTRASSKISGCRDCEHQKICNSGCLNNAYNQEGDFLSRDSYCGAYKRIFQHIKKWTKKELKKAEIVV